MAGLTRFVLELIQVKTGTLLSSNSGYVEDDVDQNCRVFDSSKV